MTQRWETNGRLKERTSGCNPASHGRTSKSTLLRTTTNCWRASPALLWNFLFHSFAASTPPCAETKTLALKWMSVSKDVSVAMSVYACVRTCMQRCATPLALLAVFQGNKASALRQYAFKTHQCLHPYPIVLSRGVSPNVLPTACWIR